MNCYIKYLIVLFAMCKLNEGSRASRMRSHRPLPSGVCPIPKIPNGSVRLQKLGRLSNFNCNDGFDIHGSMMIKCVSSRWTQDIPICIKAGCEHPPMRSNGMVVMDEKKQKSMLFCNDGFISAGNTMAFCDGKQWDRELGECRRDVGHTKSCDFETASICGWTQDYDTDFHWARRNGWVSFEKLEYGPKHDHTKGKPLDGHYMIAAATSARTALKPRLLSPIFIRSDSENSCLRFYYHMYGRQVGRLRVIIKTIYEDIDEIADNPRNILFEKNYSQENQWNEGFIAIEPVQDDFQIIFEATGNRGTFNDIAIDDVTLLKDGDCIKFMKIDIVTPETDGIYDVQSCVNRCSETESVREPGDETFIKDDHLIEKCDCHSECLTSDTCCLDYITVCNDNQPSDVDSVTSSNDDISTEVMPKEVTVTTQKITTPKPTNATTVTTVKIPLPTITTKMITTTKLITTTTTKLPNVPIVVIKVPIVDIKVPIVATNASMASIVTKLPIVVSTIATTKVPVTTSKTTRAAIVTTKAIKAENSTTLSTTVSTIKTTPSTTTRATTRTTPSTTSTVQTPPSTVKSTQWPIIIFNKHKISLNNNFDGVTSTSGPTTNAMIKSSGVHAHSILIWFSSIVIFFGLSAFIAVWWTRFSASKWNHFNSHQIEYKSKYNSDGNTESLVRSDSFTIDDSYGETLIAVNDSDDESQIEKPKTRPKKTLIAKGKAKIPDKPKKVTERSGKITDEYSEKRCLTSDDEQFDFSLRHQ